MAIIKKFINFFRSKSPSLQEMIDFRKQRHKKTKGETPLDSPFVAQIIKPLYQFWLRRWIVLSPMIVALIGIAVVLFIHFVSNTK